MQSCFLLRSAMGLRVRTAEGGRQAGRSLGCTDLRSLGVPSGGSAKERGAIGSDLQQRRLRAVLATGYATVSAEILCLAPVSKTQNRRLGGGARSVKETGHWF